MRNTSVIQDQLVSLKLENSSSIVSIAVNHMQHRLYTLTIGGVLGSYDISDHIRLMSETKLFFEDLQETWFAVDFLMIGSTVVALSREGSIVTADDNDESSTSNLENVDQIGMIDGGIRAAAWNPDYSSLAIVTGNNTMLLMSNTWEPISEIDLNPFNMTAPVNISWKGDGELLSVVSQDSSDNTYYARIYNKSLQLHATGRNVAEGAAGILKGVGGSVSFAPNGTLIAIYQRRAVELPQVAFLEKNGLRHGDFDLQKPPHPSPGITLGEWDVQLLSWDMTSTVIAVSWSAQILSAVSKTHSSNHWGCVQLYYRENYHWYMKQQWTGLDLIFLTFDNEVPGRLYFSQSSTSNSNQHDEVLPAIRIVDTFWKVSSSHCRDGTVTVTDGDTQHFTPLGYHNVPPPMSMFQEKWPNNPSLDMKRLCSRSISFWKMPNNPELSWGGAFLLNEEGLVTFVFGTERGRLFRGGYMHIPNQNHANFREIVALPIKSKDNVKLAIIAVGSTPLVCGKEETFDKSSHDLLSVVHIEIDALQQSCTSPTKEIAFAHSYIIDRIPGAIFALTSIVGEEHSLAVGIKDHDTANFDVYRLDFAHAYADIAETTEALPAHATVEFGAFPHENLLTIPEVCPHMYVAINPADGNSYYSHTVISLSLKNRLYVGEVLLVPGASSFVFNQAYNMLMFITVGTKPMLHFVTFSTLLKINPLMGEDQQDLFEAAEPRPVERGAKLIASIENDSKIIIQLPRGNLETFEPRPLIILRAQQLLNQRKVADCLLLLRLQRIDLNYLVDFDPTIFFAELVRFIPEALSKKADLLSLFITSLENVDVTTTKYVLFDETSVENRRQRRQFVDTHQFVGANKVNMICQRMREELLQCLASFQQQQTGNASQITTLINAILCTYAKQNPPLLVDALHFIQAQQQLQNTSSAHSTTNRQLQVAAIKYLVFLVDGNQLFDAAVGDCVFDLARAVARQCQMDPKAYLPLLEKFESIGRGHSPGSLPYLLMHLQVQHHLSRAWATIDDFVQLLTLWYETETTGSDRSSLISTEQVTHARQLAEEMFANAMKATGASSNATAIDDQGPSILSKLLPALVNLEMLMEEDLSSSTSTYPVIDISKTFITTTRLVYAQYCLQQMQYTSAIASFLACHPPAGQRAVDAAMAAGDWKQAISLANRFSSPNISPMKIIQDIVNNFKQNQDDSVTFANAMDVAALTVTQTITNVTSANGSLAAIAAVATTLSPSTGAASPFGGSNHTGGMEETKAMEAAKFCVDYLEDVESAVTILIMAQHWTVAMDYAGRFNRRDLYDEIYAALRVAVEDMISTLEDKTASFPEAGRILRELWTSTTTSTSAIEAADAAVPSTTTEVTLDRLHQVAQHDRMLQRILDRIEQGDDYEEAVQNNAQNQGDTQSVIQDNASDFSAASKYSLLSLRSARSSVSVQSNLSRSSQYSLSSVAASEASTTNTTGGNFSIQGLEHTLLSRGSVDPNAPPPNTGANKPSKRLQPMTKNERRRKRAAEEVEELRREREQALLDPSSTAADASGSSGSAQEENDYTRRRARRHERSRYRAQEKNKDEAGLKRENDQVDCLWQAVASLAFVIQTMYDICHLLSLNHGQQVTDHVLSVRLQGTVDQYVITLQKTLEQVPPAPEYPLPWLQQRSMPHIQFFQDVRILYQHILQWRINALQSKGIDGNHAGAAGAIATEQTHMVRLEDMAMLRRYEYDVWHVLKQGIQHWTRTKLLVRQLPATA